MAQLNDLIVSGESRFINTIHGTIENSEKLDNHSVPASGNASSDQVVLGNDTRLTDSRTPASHTHGNIQNGGTLQTTDVAIANGDKLVVTDSSDSNKIARTSLAFDGSTTTKALSQKGTWETFSGTDTATTVSYTKSIGTGTFKQSVSVNGGIATETTIFTTTYTDVGSVSDWSQGAFPTFSAGTTPVTFTVTDELLTISNGTAPSSTGGTLPSLTVTPVTGLAKINTPT